MTNEVVDVSGDLVFKDDVDSPLTIEITGPLQGGVEISYRPSKLTSAQAERLIKITGRALGVLLRKNADYGSTANRVAVLAPNISTVDALLVRMSDKVARMANLRSRGGSGDPLVASESYYDTVNDLFGYCALLMAQLDIEMEALSAKS